MTKILKKVKNTNGIALVTVIAVFLLASVFAIGVVQFSSTASRTAYVEEQRGEAYYYARAACELITERVIKSIDAETTKLMYEGTATGIFDPENRYFMTAGGTVIHEVEMTFPDENGADMTVMAEVHVEHLRQDPGGSMESWHSFTVTAVPRYKQLPGGPRIGFGSEGNFNVYNPDASDRTYSAADTVPVSSMASQAFTMAVRFQNITNTKPFPYDGALTVQPGGRLGFDGGMGYVMYDPEGSINPGNLYQNSSSGVNTAITHPIFFGSDNRVVNGAQMRFPLEYAEWWNNYRWNERRKDNHYLHPPYRYFDSPSDTQYMVANHPWFAAVGETKEYPYWTAPYFSGTVKVPANEPIVIAMPDVYADATRQDQPWDHAFTSVMGQVNFIRNPNESHAAGVGQGAETLPDVVRYIVRKLGLRDDPLFPVSARTLTGGHIIGECTGAGCPCNFGAMHCYEVCGHTGGLSPADMSDTAFWEVIEELFKESSTHSGQFEYFSSAANFPPGSVNNFRSFNTPVPITNSAWMFDQVARYIISHPEFIESIIHEGHMPVNMYVITGPYENGFYNDDGTVPPPSAWATNRTPGGNGFRLWDRVTGDWVKVEDAYGNIIGGSNPRIPLPVYGTAVNGSTTRYDAMRNPNPAINPSMTLASESVTWQAASFPKRATEITPQRVTGIRPGSSPGMPDAPGPWDAPPGVGGTPAVGEPIANIPTYAHEGNTFFWNDMEKTVRDAINIGGATLPSNITDLSSEEWMTWFRNVPGNNSAGSRHSSMQTIWDNLNLFINSNQMSTHTRNIEDAFLAVDPTAGPIGGTINLAGFFAAGYDTVVFECKPVLISQDSNWTQGGSYGGCGHSGGAGGGHMCYFPEGTSPATSRSFSHSAGYRVGSTVPGPLEGELYNQIRTYRLDSKLIIPDGQQLTLIFYNINGNNSGEGFVLGDNAEFLTSKTHPDSALHQASVNILIRQPKNPRDPAVIAMHGGSESAARSNLHIPAGTTVFGYPLWVRSGFTSHIDCPVHVFMPDGYFLSYGLEKPFYGSIYARDIACKGGNLIINYIPKTDFAPYLYSVGTWGITPPSSSAPPGGSGPRYEADFLAQRTWVMPKRP